MPSEVIEMVQTEKTEELMKIIREASRQVESGEVRALGVAIITKNREIKTNWCVVVAGYMTSLMGALDYLKHRICCYIDRN